MKIKIARYKQITKEGEVVSIVTRLCPFPKKSNQSPDTKVGSFACGFCIQNKGKNRDFVFCRAGDKKRGRKIIKRRVSE